MHLVDVREDLFDILMVDRLVVLISARDVWIKLKIANTLVQLLLHTLHDSLVAGIIRGGDDVLAIEGLFRRPLISFLLQFFLFSFFVCSGRISGIH